MKKIIQPILIAIFFCLFSWSGTILAQNVAINTTNAAPDPSAILDISSDTKGVLIPRVNLLSLTDQLTILSPANGLMVYNMGANVPAGFYYNAGTPVNILWTKILASNINDWSTQGNTSTNNDFIGTLNNAPLRFKVNSALAGLITYSNDNTGLGYGSLPESSTGFGNSAIGAFTLTANTTGAGNVGVGLQALNTNTTGSRNIALGSQALGNNTSGDNNIAMGYHTLNNNNAGHENIAIGYQALFNSTSSYANIAIGQNAIYSNQTGHHTLAIGNASLFNSKGSFAIGVGDSTLYSLTDPLGLYFNIGIGNKALYATTTGKFNTAIGYYSMVQNTAGMQNVAVGYKSLNQNSTGYENTGTGNEALKSNTIGIQNTAVGAFSLPSNTVGQINTAIGDRTLYSNLGGNSNTAIGAGSMYANTDGGNNTAVGVNTLRNNTTGNFNLALGISTLYQNNTGNYNVAFGIASLYSNTSGSNNIAIGKDALYANTTKNLNVAIGDSTLRSNGIGAADPSQSVRNIAIGNKALLGNTTGFDNIAIGYKNLQTNSTGFENISIGVGTLGNNSGGYQNVVVGDNALQINSSGHNNVGIGKQIMYNNTSGNYNTAVGEFTLNNNVTGSKNTALGYNANVTLNNLQYATSIGAEAVVNCSNCMVLGGTGTASTYVGINTTTPNADLVVRQKSDLLNNTSRGLKLQRNTGAATFWRTYVDGSDLLTFEYDDLGDGNWAYITTNGDFISGSDARIKKDVQPLLGTLDKIRLLAPKSYHYTHQEEGDPLHYGLIAQELENIYPDMVYTRENGTKGIAYTQLIAVALDGIKEQQATIDTLQAQNQELMTRLKALENAVAAINSKQ